MQYLISKIVSALGSRVRSSFARVRRAWMALACPSVRFQGGGQVIEHGVVLRATNGGAVSLGQGCAVRRDTEIVAKSARLDIAEGTFVGPWCTIVATCGISIGRNCLIAERVTIRDHDHAIRAESGIAIKDAGMNSAPIVIGEDVWIAAGAVVLKGTTIGRGAVVAANAVVTRDVADYEIVGGVPAKRIGERRRDAVYADIA